MMAVQQPRYQQQQQQHRRRSLRIPLIQSRAKKWDRCMQRRFEKAKCLYPKKFPVHLYPNCDWEKRTRNKLPDLVAELIREKSPQCSTSEKMSKLAHNNNGLQPRLEPCQAPTKSLYSNDRPPIHDYDPGYEVDNEYEEELVCCYEQDESKHDCHSYHFSNQLNVLNHPYVIERFKVRVFYS
ncbi:hypothetical protein C9374_006045 [Naegleria lovaniensis]|uniref:Uncharacterized protein n=1 Tax=Naegleria lovaniensis TaxID=51637 RepID=A0AA88GIM0_NAELO|nr:uncharacterized protein C9374_006045 [Naegleria lovaniensis]KAG2381661.1 hypothetical protein C9374_006045 [Naegleria lovaniensis]